jgi:hypothetical protein
LPIELNRQSSIGNLQSHVFAEVGGWQAAALKSPISETEEVEDCEGFDCARGPSRELLEKAGDGSIVIC